VYEVKKGNRLEEVVDNCWLPAGVVGSCFGVNDAIKRADK